MVGVLFMRLNDFTTIDEIVDLGIVEFKKRSFAPAINWVPPRQNVYMSQCNKYSALLLSIAEDASNNDIIESDMNPSQFIKAAQDFQLAARLSGMDKNIILKYFMKLANIGMALKRHYYDLYSQKVLSMTFETFSELLLLTKVHYNAWLSSWYAKKILSEKTETHSVVDRFLTRTEGGTN